MSTEFAVAAGRWLADRSGRGDVRVAVSDGPKPAVDVDAATGTVTVTVPGGCATSTVEAADLVVQGLLVSAAARLRHQLAAALPPDTAPEVLAAAAELDAVRAERKFIRANRSYAVALRAASPYLGSTPGTDLPDRRIAARCAIEVLARADVHLASADEATAGRVRDQFGADFDELRALWRESLCTPDGEADTFVDVCERWVALTTRAAGAAGRAVPTGSGHDETADGESRETEESVGDGEADNADVGEPASAATPEGRDVSAGQADDEAVEDGPTDEPDPISGAEAVAEARARTRRARAARRRSDDVFDNVTPAQMAALARLRRDPTGGERAAATRLATQLRSAQFRGGGKGREFSALPPGRLVGSQMVLGEAQRALGLEDTSTPFRRTVRHRSARPTLSVAILADVSGSMRPVTGAVSSASWIVAQAVHQLRGRSTTVLFGQQVVPLVRPGLAPRQVTDFHARDNTERFTAALEAVDGALTLSKGRDARLVFIVSDGAFRPHERARGTAAMHLLAERGVRFFWVHPEQVSIPYPAVSIPVEMRSGSDILSALPGAIGAAIRDDLAARP